ncbi:helix-turn-helix transcriptional regulator [Specibacter sp. NPDC078692]|uniref:helix-turn-helix domain-containing protein n=1 Tax=Specibacter sp. NPDC078692 TaxID=3155818 RepID=UPI00343199A8
MDLDEFLGIDNSDPVQRLANDLVQEDDQLLSELVELRRRTMTQQDVATRLGISRPAVAAFERYDADPKLSTVRRYALAIRAFVAHTVTAEAQGRESFEERALDQWHADLANCTGKKQGSWHLMVGRVGFMDVKVAVDTDSPVQDRLYHDTAKKFLTGKR